MTDRSSFEDIPQQMSRILSHQSNMSRLVIATKYVINNMSKLVIVTEYGMSNMSKLVIATEYGMSHMLRFVKSYQLILINENSFLHQL